MADLGLITSRTAAPEHALIDGTPATADARTSKHQTRLIIRVPWCSIPRRFNCLCPPYADGSELSNLLQAGSQGFLSAFSQAVMRLRRLKSPIRLRTTHCLMPMTDPGGVHTSTAKVWFFFTRSLAPAPTVIPCLAKAIFMIQCPILILPPWIPVRVTMSSCMPRDSYTQLDVCVVFHVGPVRL